MAAASPNESICAACKRVFTVDPTVWPSNICSDCRAKPVKCKGTKRTRQAEEPCDVSFPGTDLNPTVEGGLDHCRDCRVALCHACGKEPKASDLRRCARCHLDCTFCVDCPAEGETCLPPSKRVPPAALTKLKVTPSSSVISGCSAEARKPIYYGHKATPETDDGGAVRSLTTRDAVLEASAAFEALLELARYLDGVRRDLFRLPASQNTMAIALLECDDHFRLILTYSNYDLAAFATSVKQEHPTFRDLVVEADPHVIHNERGHYLLDRIDFGANAELQRFMTNCSTMPAHAENLAFITKYSLAEHNLHHAEMRAYFFAAKRGYRIVYLAPTKECCPRCRESLEAILECVPAELRNPEDPSLVYFALDEEAGTVMDEDHTWQIHEVPGNGNCLFYALLASGAVPAQFGGDHEALRANVAAAIADPAIANAVGTQNAPVDTEHLVAIANAIGCRIVLYEAYYGRRYGHHCTEIGAGGPEIRILSRSLAADPRGHYDLLRDPPPEEV